MKKIGLFVLVLLVLIVTGCSNEVATPDEKVVEKVKRMVCTQKVQTVNVNMIADFKNEELTYLGLRYEMDLSAYNDAQINAVKNKDMCSTVGSTIQNYTAGFTNCRQAVENKVLLITADFDLDKIADEGLTKNTSIEAAKASLEKQSYTCVISDKYD